MGKRPGRIKQGPRQIIETRLQAQKKKGEGHRQRLVSRLQKERRPAWSRSYRGLAGPLTPDPWAQARLLSTAFRAGLRLCSPHKGNTGRRS